MPELHFMIGGSPRTLLLEGEGPVGIGRGADNPVVFDDPNVSRHHAQLVADERGWRLEDLGSSNGTQVNGQKVVFAPLRDGARITIGPHELVFVAAETAAPTGGAGEVTAGEGESGYFLSRSEQRFGPYSWQQLQELSAGGRIGPDDLVWGQEMQRWTPAGSVLGLLPAPADAGGAASPGAPRSAKPGCSKLLLLLVPVAAIILITVVLAVLLTGGGGEDQQWQAATLGLDDDDWENYPDLDSERQQIEQSLAGFQSALRAGDVERSVTFVTDERRGTYAALFRNRPEAMASFADLLESSEMSFLGAPMDPSLELTIRSAEYTVTLDGFDFYVRWGKVDGQWVLLDL